MEKRWTILTADEEKVAALQSQLKIHPALCKILVQRGIKGFEAAKKYFRPSLDELHDPWLMKDMDKAVERIIKAVNAKEKIPAPKIKKVHRKINVKFKKKKEKEEKEKEKKKKRKKKQNKKKKKKKEEKEKKVEKKKE